ASAVTAGVVRGSGLVGSMNVAAGNRARVAGEHLRSLKGVVCRPLRRIYCDIDWARRAGRRGAVGRAACKDVVAGRSIVPGDAIGTCSCGAKQVGALKEIDARDRTAARTGSC